MRFSQDFIEKVRDANNLVDIISQHTELRRTGDRLMGRCPFPDHAEKTPSFSLSEDKQLYHCFGCKKSGNVFTFLETYNGMSFPEAVEYLAKRAHIALPIEEGGRPGAAANRDARASLLKINAFAAEYFHQQLRRLPKDHPAVSYLQKRGLTAEIIDTFRIGITLENWEGLVTFLLQKRVPLPLAESLGLIKRKKSSQESVGQGSGYFDMFRGRVMFPIITASDEILGFGGRVFAEGTPKYLNSPESAVFSKGRVLYGLHESGRYIRTEDRAILVEGYMDAIALSLAGIRNVVAILGTAFTAEHAKLLKRYTNNVTVLLDGDQAGMTAAERSLPILLQAGLLTKGCFLADGLDPDDFLKKNGATALREELARAPELFDLVLGRWMRDYRGTAGEKVKLVEDLYPILKGMENSQLRDLYTTEIARRLDVEVSWLMRAFVSVGKKENAAPGPGAAAVPLPLIAKTAEATTAELTPLLRAEPLLKVSDAPRNEAFVLSLALHNETLFREAKDNNLIEFLSHSGIRSAFALVLEKYGQKPDEFDRLAASLASQVDTPSIVTCSLEVTRRISLKPGSEEVDAATIEAEERRLMTDYVNAIQKRYLRDQAKALANQLRDQANVHSNVQAKSEMLEQFMNIQKVRHSLDRD